jgi:exodeoxyribonuclease VII large subunit
MMFRALSLYELNQQIRSLIDTSFPRTFLVTAEIASLDVKRHCYMTLVDKHEASIRAEMRAVIWASRLGMVSAEFKSATGVELTKGIRILFEASVRFHERYGLSLDIINIDPSYTLGELSAKRAEVLERLSREGLKDRNKSLEFPLVPKRIGVISSSTAAGYEDLVSHLINNPYNFSFSCRLYEAFMQGEKAEASIVKAIKRCINDSSLLDVVVIVRGGGGKADLHCFDSYEIGKAVASLHVPVISGIGHLRDNTVLDEVSNMMAKTPTAVADLIITRVRDFEDAVENLANRLVRGTARLTFDLRERLSFLAKTLQGAAGDELQIKLQKINSLIRGLAYSSKLTDMNMRYLVESSSKIKALVSKDLTGLSNIIDSILTRLITGSHRLLIKETVLLESRDSNLYHLDPRNVLKRGYSITMKDGKSLKSVSELKINDKVSTVLYDGKVKSIVEDYVRRLKE